MNDPEQEGKTIEESIRLNCKERRKIPSWSFSSPKLSLHSPVNTTYEWSFTLSQSSTFLIFSFLAFTLLDRLGWMDENQVKLRILFLLFLLLNRNLLSLCLSSLLLYSWTVNKGNFFYPLPIFEVILLYFFSSNERWMRRNRTITSEPTPDEKERSATEPTPDWTPFYS